MRRENVFFAVVAVLALSANVARANDASDPLFLEKQHDLTLNMSTDISSGYFQFRQAVSYGITSRFTTAADIHYRIGNDYGNNEFSNVGIMGKYRAGSGGTGATDVLFGYGYGGLSQVPDFSDHVYSMGFRTGKQWDSGMTLAFTTMTNWIFNKDSGYAYIDLTPEAYFKVRGGWALGAGATIRKVTKTSLDEYWLNARVGSVIGKTGWFVNLGYEIESTSLKVGGSVSMLF